MIALNSTSIFVGQIKQILHDFNLPLCKIGNKNLTPNSYYIHNDNIYYYNKDKISVFCYDYDYNVPYLNITNNFVVENMLYDRATHEYLGKYLRFLRDYQGINLMSMYNCFDGELLTVDVNFTVKPISEKPEIKIEFASNNKGYVVYKIPVSLVDIYSISLHNTKNIEICLYNEADSLKPDTDLSKYALSKATYKQIQATNVIYYEPAVGPQTLVPSNLYMLIKVPKDLNTSITVLEGRYYSNYNKLNVAPIGTEQPELKIAAQLLSTENTYGNNLLADRIVEYLTGSVICKLSASYDIKRLQLTLDSLYNITSVNKPPIPKITGRMYGIWDDRDIELIKYLAIKHDLIKYDSLGYVDKDIENYLIGNTAFDTIEFNIIKNEGDSAVSA